MTTPRHPPLQKCPIDDCHREPEVLDMNGLISISCPKGHIIIHGKKMKHVAKEWNQRRFNQKV